MYSQPIICEMLSLADHATAYYYQKHPFSWKHLHYVSRSSLDVNYPRFKDMARHLGVSRRILAYRMKYLNILTSDVPYRHILPLMEIG